MRAHRRGVCARVFFCVYARGSDLSVRLRTAEALAHAYSLVRVPYAMLSLEVGRNRSRRRNIALAHPLVIVSLMQRRFRLRQGDDPAPQAPTSRTQMTIRSGMLILAPVPAMRSCFRCPLRDVSVWAPDCADERVFYSVVCIVRITTGKYGPLSCACAETCTTQPVPHGTAQACLRRRRLSRRRAVHL